MDLATFIVKIVDITIWPATVLVIIYLVYLSGRKEVNKFIEKTVNKVANDLEEKHGGQDDGV